MFIRTLPVGVFQCNCAIVACEATRQALVVDPGDEPERILEIVRAHALEVTDVVHTHAHLDHVMGTQRVVDATGATARLHRRDRRLWDGIGWVAASYGIPEPKLPPLGAWLADGDTIAFGRVQARVIHTPGHTPGSCCFALATGDEPAVLLSGDTLFRGRIGIVDPERRGGTDPLITRAIVAAIRDRLLPFPDDTRVVPGHGPDTCIGAERRHNPFLTSV
jgi:glyoxylase-like metal-dependent hydrolase (beta-lactamase superfamily II)